MWAPGKIPAGARYGEMMSHIDCWATLATMVGLTPPPHGAWKDNDGKPIYFDSIDNSAYIMGKAKHSARNGGSISAVKASHGMRADIGDDPENPDLTNRLEIPIYRQGHLARSKAGPWRHRLDL